MSQITKELFISSIEAIRIQMYKDVVNADCIAKMFNTENVVGYDTSLVTTKLIELLQVHFPKDTNGFCDIEHYCFDTNFGKIEGQELITPEDLWDRLSMDKITDGITTIYKKPWDLLNNTNYIKTDASESPKGILHYIAPKESIISTHPLIDDNPKKSLKVIIEEEKQKVVNLRDNDPKYEKGTMRDYIHGKHSAFEEVLKILEEYPNPDGK